MVAPVSFSITPRQTTTVEPSPYRIVVVAPRDSGVQAVANQPSVITDSTADTGLGTNTVARRWYDHIESKAAVHLSFLPYTPSTNNDNAATNAVNALDGLLNARYLQRIGGPPDLIVIPDITGIGTGANSVVTKLETVCADTRVGAIGIVDAYHEGDAQADAITWQGNNNGADILAITNKANTGAVEEWGSIIAAGHIAQYSASQGVGSQVFNLRHPVTGVSAISPERVFNIADDTAAANVLGDTFLSSLIVFGGSDFLWGGKLNTAQASDPRRFFGNAVIAKRMAKRAVDLLADFVHQPISGLLLSTIGTVVEDSLLGEFGALVSEIIVPAATRDGTRVTVRPTIRFFGFVESIQVSADVYIGG